MDSVIVENYPSHLRQLPSLWCAGCGCGIVMGAMLRAIENAGLDETEVTIVCGIGCSGRMSTYTDFNTLHTTHGRALAFATGIKLAKPEMTVIVIMGDGDALAIGGNHFIHAARRNIDLTAIVVNNMIYGMTGGQLSPTTPMGDKAVTAPWGHIESPFDAIKLAEAAGASFGARGTVYHALELEKLISLAMQKKGFAVVDALSSCPLYYGKFNELGSPSDMLEWFRENTTPAGKETEDKIPRGVLLDRELPEFTAEYEKLVARIQKEER